MGKFATRSAAIVMPLLLTAPAANGHSWYTGLVGPGGQNCCGGEDCELIAKEFLRKAGETIQIWHGGMWYDVTDYNLLSMASPDGRVHACFHQMTGAMMMLCVVLPGSD